MAETAALTATVRARLDEFERDMRKAEDIIGNAIDKMERELGVKLDVGKRLEESLHAAQPRLRSATIAIGNLMSQAIIQGLRLAQKALDDFVDQFKQIQSAAQLTGISIERIATLTKAIGSQGVPQALEQVATLLDRARRGEENALVKLLAENKQSIAGIRDAADAWERVARIIATARNQIQAREIAKSVGIDQETADRLFELGRGFDAAVEAARPFGERLAEISEKARQFEDALNKLWKALIEIAKALAQNLAAVLAPAIELLASALDLLATKGAAFWETFGVTNLAGLEKVQTAAKLIRDLADALRELSGQTTGDRAPLRVTVGPGAGGGPAERQGPFGRPIPLTRPTGGGAEGRDPFEREQDRIRRSIALHEAEARTIGQTAEARERARTVAVLEEAAIRANTAAGLENTAVTAKQREDIEKLADAMEQVIRRQSQMQFIASEMRNLAGLLSGAIEEMVFQGKKLDEVLRNIAQRLASRALQQALERLLVTAGTGLFGGGGGFGFNPATAFSFGRQAGGHVVGGRSYLVGEQGPELFVPTQSGQVIPNHALGGGMGGVVINQTYDARGADPAAIRRLELIIAEDRRALPGRVMASITDAKRRSAGR